MTLCHKKRAAMTLIDIHTHIYPPAIARKAAASIREFYELDTAEFLNQCDDACNNDGDAVKSRESG